MQFYKMRTGKPSGPMYHGPGNPDSKRGLSLYHIANSIRGIRTAKAKRAKWIDNDYMLTGDGVIVCSHSFGLMEKEHFRAAGVPMLPIDRLTWAQVRRLVGPQGYKVQRIETMFASYRDLNMGVALELKGDAREGFRLITPYYMDYIVQLANHYGVRMYVKAARKRGLGKGLNMMRARGVWTRFNGGAFRPPVVHP